MTYREIKNTLQTMEPSDIIKLTRFFGLNEFNDGNKINNLLEGGMPKITDQLVLAEARVVEAEIGVAGAETTLSKSINILSKSRQELDKLKKKQLLNKEILSKKIPRKAKAKKHAIIPVPGILRDDSSIFSKQITYDNSFQSLIPLFGTPVFVDEESNELDGTVCVSMTFPETTAGKYTNTLKIKDFHTLKQKVSYEEILANYIFIPTHITNKNTLFSCRLDILVERRRGTPERNLMGRHYFNTAQVLEKTLAPNANGLYMLLNCVITGCNFLYSHNYDILSLELTDILHLHTRAGFLITNYSIIQEGELQFSIQIKKFIKVFMILYNNYIGRMKESIALKDAQYKSYNDIIAELNGRLDGIDHAGRIGNLTKINKINRCNKDSYLADLLKYESGKVIPAIKEHLIPLIDGNSAKPDEIYKIYTGIIMPEINKK